MVFSSGTLRPNLLRRRLASPPLRGIHFALVCSECLFTWYFESQAEALSARSRHEHQTTLFCYEFLPTRHLPSGFTLREHVWLGIVDIPIDDLAGLEERNKPQAPPPSCHCTENRAGREFSPSNRQGRSIAVTAP